MRSDTSVPKLVPKREVDAATGIMTVDYYWEKRLAPKVRITGKLVDQLSGYTLIQKDLNNALRWIRLAEKLARPHQKAEGSGYAHATDREAFDLIKAYFVASLAFYGKCFTEASGRHANASRDWLDKKYRDLHDLYMNYRHNFAAHSGDEQLELAETYVLVHPDRNALIPHLPTARLQPDVALPKEGELGLVELIQHVEEKVVERYDKLAHKIIHELIIPAGAKYWSAAADKTEPVLIGVPLKSKC